jgi:CBS domain-containing protein
MRTSPSEGRAGQWMTADPVTVSVRSTVATAVRLMTEYDIHYVPVVDHGHVVGMLDADDTLRRAEVLPIGLGL